MVDIEIIKNTLNKRGYSISHETPTFVILDKEQTNTRKIILKEDGHTVTVEIK